MLQSFSVNTLSNCLFANCIVHFTQKFVLKRYNISTCRSVFHFERAARAVSETLHLKPSLDYNHIYKRDIYYNLVKSKNI